MTLNMELLNRLRPDGRLTCHNLWVLLELRRRNDYSLLLAAGWTETAACIVKGRLQADLVQLQLPRFGPLIAREHVMDGWIRWLLQLADPVLLGQFNVLN